MANKLFDDVTKMVTSTEIKNKLKRLFGAVTGKENFDDVYLPRLAFIQTTTKSIANTTTETSHFNDTGAIGSRTIPANTLRKGSVVRVQLFSDLSNLSTPTNVLKIKIGSTAIITSSAELVVNTNSLAKLYLEFLVTTAGASGKILMQGYTEVTGSANSRRKFMITTPIDFNTTIANTLDITYTWGTANAANILACTNATIEVVQ